MEQDVFDDDHQPTALDLVRARVKKEAHERELENNELRRKLAEEERINKQRKRKLAKKLTLQIQSEASAAIERQRQKDYDDCQIYTITTGFEQHRVRHGWRRRTIRTPVTEEQALYWLERDSDKNEAYYLSPSGAFFISIPTEERDEYGYPRLMTQPFDPARFEHCEPVLLGILLAKLKEL